MNAVRYSPGSSNMNEYCLPVYLNGNGIFTSQLGLIGIATTDASGNFNSMFTACGSGNDAVIAQYYGYPPPEPITVYQPSLQYSANVMPPATSWVPANEFNYAYSPAVSTMQISIGNYALGFGGINIVGLVVFISALLVVVFLRGLRYRNY